jgi:hypothetical protein
MLTHLDTWAGFCWTKYGTEAGQPVEAILARKELERQRNPGGVFLWGIGNSIGPSLRALLADVVTPTAVFTPMQARPRRIDTHPPAVVRWTAGVGLDGSAYTLPEHCVVTGRRNPARPRKHYALVCASDRPLTDSPGGRLHRSQLRNYVRGTAVGPSQVTAVVRSDDDGPAAGVGYPIGFAARLVYPFLVELTTIEGC